MLGAPIVKPLLGKAAVPDDSPYTTGGIGLLGTRPSQEAMEECDTLLMVGTQLPLHRVLSRSPARRAASRSTSTRCGSACATRWKWAWSATHGARCSALLPLLERQADRSFLERRRTE